MNGGRIATKWRLFAFSFLIVGLAPFAKAPARALVRPLRTGAAPSLAAKAGLKVLDSYGASLWCEASSSGGLEAIAGDAVVDLYPDWDIVKTPHPFSVYDKPGLGAIAAPGLYILHFNGPIRAEWLQQLSAVTGLMPVQPFPNLSYIVWVAHVESPLKLQLPNLDWAGALAPEDRLSPELPKARAGGIEEACVLLCNAGGVEDDIEALKAICVVKSVTPANGTPFRRALVEGGVDALAAAARLPRVLWIEPSYPEKLLDEVQSQIVAGNYAPGQPGPTGPGYEAWLSSHGLSNLSDVTVDVCDDGWDTGNLAVGQHNAEFDDAAGTTCRMSALFSSGTCDANHGAGGHGNINQSIVMGRGVHSSDPSGYAYGEGIAPSALGTATKIFSDSGAWCGPNPIDTTLIWPAYQAGARITSNSWGAAAGGAYTTDSQFFDMAVRDANLNAADGLQPLTMVFAAGNSGYAANTVGSPGTAKNVITSGASENYRMTGTDGCGIDNSGADNLNDIAFFSSRGPCADGRVKPDAMAPGTHIQGAASQYSGYTGATVCDKYWPAGQTWYAWSSGTSHSTPAMAGAAALIYHYYNAQTGSYPSPAMIKAVMLATSDDMAGGSDGKGGATANIPNNDQGWGRVNLGRMADGSACYAYDQASLFTAAGQSFSPTPLFSVADATKPVRILLVWTDAPGNPNAVPSGGLVNNLDLAVAAGGNTYLGNNFRYGYSCTGGSADTTNNVEAVYFPAGQKSTFSLNVLAASIAGDGVPGNGSPADQDFALFIYNAKEQTSAGFIGLDKALYSCSATVTITVSDLDLRDASPGATITVSIASTTESTPETVTLTQTGANTGVYTGTIATTSAAPVHGDGLLSVADGDGITATYHDANNGQGVAVDVHAMASADCVKPLVTNVAVSGSGATWATITWQTNEMADSKVTYGASKPPGLAASDSFSTLNHSVTLAGLSPCTNYYFSVSSTDVAGNTATDDNAGSFYTFSTLGQAVSNLASSDVPQAITDFNTATSALNVSDTRLVSNVTVTLNITHTWDRDLWIRLRHPDGTAVTLSQNHPVGSGANYTKTTFDDSAATPIANGTAPFTGTFKPDGPLSALNGKPANGTWKLEVYDGGAGDTGTVDSWTLNLTVAAPCGASLQYQSSSVVDACHGTGAGGGDGIIDPGEDVTLPVTLFNAGFLGVSNVSAILSTTTPGVTIEDDTAAFPDIAGSSTGTSLSPHFTFSVDPSLPCGTALNFGLQICSSQGPSTGGFALAVGQSVPTTLLSEGFEADTGTSLPPGWLVQTIQATPWQRTPLTAPCDGTFHMRSYYNSTLASNTWAFTPGLSLQAGKTYTLSFKQHVGSASYPEKLSVYLGTAQNNGSMTTLLWEDLNLTNAACITRSPTFTVPSSGTYYVGFWAHSDANMYAICVDDVAVTTSSCAASPCSPSLPDEVPSPSLQWAAGTKLQLQWDAIATASAYRLYRGTPADLPNLLNSNTDSCLRWSGAETNTGSLLAEVPAAGSFFWYLVRGANTAGEGSAGNATGGARVLNSTGACQSSGQILYTSSGGTNSFSAPAGEYISRLKGYWSGGWGYVTAYASGGTSADILTTQDAAIYLNDLTVPPGQYITKIGPDGAEYLGVWLNDGSFLGDLIYNNGSANTWTFSTYQALAGEAVTGFSSGAGTLNAVGGKVAACP